ncbi:MlaD family protein [Conexibacter sp. SYSU D00693]|uniref:MlaD family protein n=1 Tax=Conexibacter sp. SYSU D00693 TaxID=2812560 RepID=UPI00196A63BB|nr:MlaD family protein [Conexibacter sp. SYSU D00693]
MRRLLTTGAVALVAGGGTFLAVGAGDDESASGYRVDALFRNAGFLVPGQDVKVAGAKVGQVEDVTLDGRRARIQMRVDEEFGPFKADARCTIQPQSLIGEKFVQCTPGTADAKPLAARGDAVPTMGLDQTTTPIDLDLVLGALREPTTTQTALLVSALGGGLAGRAEDLNATIREADPAFAETEKLLTQVNGERRTIQALLRDADRVVDVLADRREDVADFVRDARRATGATSRRSAELRETVRGLPALLDEARPSLAQLRALGEDGTSVAADLAAAAPAAERLVDRLGPFAKEVQPTLTQLGTTARAGRRAVGPVAPQVRRLARFATAARPAGAQLAELFESMRDRGAVEGLLRFVYYATTATARYDSVSHILPAYLQAVDACNLYAVVTIKSCDAHFAEGGRSATPARQRRAKAKSESAPEREQAPAAPVTTPAPQAPAKEPEKPGTLDGLLKDLPKTVQDLPKAIQELPKALQDTVKDLVEGTKGLLDGKKDQPAQGQQPSGGAVDRLLDLLLGP